MSSVTHQPLEPKPVLVPPLSLVRKLCAAGAELGWIKKSGTNQFHGYKYATEADLVAALRGELYKRNVFLFPNVVHSERKALTITTKNGQRETALTDIVVDWTFVDGDSGETWTCQVPGCGEDSGDKGIYKAMTGSEKYMLMKAFLIPTGDDPESDTGADYTRAKAAAEKVADRKLAEHAAKSPAAPKGTGKLSVEHTDGDESRLSGTGLAELLSALDAKDPHFKKTFMRFDEETFFWFVKTAKAFVLQDICTSIGIEASMLEPGSEGPTKAVIPPLPKVDAPAKPSTTVASQSMPSSAPSTTDSANGYFPITAMTTKTVKADKDGNVIKVSLTWDGKTREVATWFHGLFGLLTDCYMKKTPVKLVIVDKGNYSNVVGVHGAEKGDDGIWRFPVQRELI